MSKSSLRRWFVRGASLGLLLAPGLASAQQPTTCNGQQFFPLDPCRVVDTRSSGALGQGGPIVTNVATPVGSSARRNFQVRGFGSCGVPSDAGSVAYNLTVLGGGAAGGVEFDQPFRGHATVFAANLAATPTASHVNFPPHLTIANAGITRLQGSPSWTGDFGVSLFLADGETASLGASVHVVLDVTGYFKKCY